MKFGTRWNASLPKAQRRALLTLLVGGLFLGDPIALLRLAVALGFHFASDGVAADLPVIFDHDFVPVELARDLEGHFVTLDLAVLDGGVAVPSGNGAGQFVAVGL